MVLIAVNCFSLFLFSFTGLFFFFCTLAVQAQSQSCDGISQYGRCSSNTECACFHMQDATEIGICGFEWVACSKLVACENTTNHCYKPGHACIHHPRCHNFPICYPMSMAEQKICPPQATIIPTIPANARWSQNGVTVAGGNGKGSATNQLYNPYGIFVDDDQTIVIADFDNHRVVQWKKDDTNGQVVAGGKGAGLNQLNVPTYIFIDRQQTVYVSDSDNNRVIKWDKDATTGIIIAGGKGDGSALTQLSHPTGLAVDTLSSLYVADNGNHRVLRWHPGAPQSTAIVGGNGEGSAENQLRYLRDLSFDSQNNLFVVDHGNARVQRFSIQ